MKHYKVPFIITNFNEIPSDYCIWCKKSNNKNIAHILSRKILKTNHKNNKLISSVCKNCNSFFGSNIEDWLFKYSPFNYWIKTSNGYGHGFYLKDDKSIDYKKIFLWFEEYNEWFISTNIKNEQFPPQLIFTGNNKATLYNYRNTIIQKSTRKAIDFQKTIKSQDFTTYISSSLPYNFKPRIIVFKNKYIIVAKNKTEVKIVKNFKFADSNLQNATYELKTKMHKKLLVQYKWSVKKYIKFCSKIAFEFLSIFKGSGFVLSSDFDGFRNFFHNDKKDDSLELSFLSGKGLLKNRLTIDGWVSICENINISKSFKIPYFLLDTQNTFSLILYKVDNYLCASVKLFEIESCNIIIAEFEKPLESIYLVTYSSDLDKLIFYEGAGIEERIDKEVIFFLNEEISKLIN